MNRIFEVSERSYYTNFLCIIAISITFLISLKKKKLLPQLKFLPVYLGSFLILNAITYIPYLLDLKPPNLLIISRINRTWDFIVTVIEFFTFTYYLYSVLKTVKFKKTIKLTGVVFLGVTFLYSIHHLYNLTPISTHALHNVYIIESLTLLIFCFLYFIELFRFPPVNNLLESPDFWISTGLMFYLLCTFPVTILTDYLSHMNTLFYYDAFTLINIFYTLLFLAIIKAYFCPSMETKPEATTRLPLNSINS
jgi:hypothetical protein